MRKTADNPRPSAHPMAELDRYADAWSQPGAATAMID
jgi:hypothetical protein